MSKEELEFIQQLITTCVPVKIIYITNENKHTFISEQGYPNHPFFLQDTMHYFKHYFKDCYDGMICNIITPIYLHYSVLCISKELDEHIIFGPFLDHVISFSTIYEVIDLLRLTIEHTSSLKLFYQSLHIFDISQIVEIVYLIKKRLLGDTFTSVPVTMDFRQIPNKKKESELSLNEIDESISYKDLEERYALEDQLLQCITNGDTISAVENAKKFLITINTISRNKDSIRNNKNLLIVGNTIYRKAAQAGGVHPVYLDDISAKWAIRIENSNSLEALNDISLQMVRGYSILVKNHSLAQYSPIVKKAITYINLHLGSTLTAAKVAKEVGVSPDYLTRLFKKELDLAVIHYINKKRIEASLKLINSSDLNIQDIGYMVGINDTSYFSKLFKKYIGVSPKQYRENLQ